MKKLTAAAANVPLLINVNSDRLFNAYSLTAQVIPKEAIITKQIASIIITLNIIKILHYD
jgi:hypothetical protein